MKELYSTENRLALIAITVTLLTILLVTPSVFSTNGGVSVLYGPEKISTGGDEDTPVIALDSYGSAHIVWVNGSQGYFLMYKMVDADGNVLIDETILNPCADNTSKHVRRPAMVIDANNDMHVVFHGFSNYTDFGPDEYGSRVDLAAPEILYMKINPYLDDRDGSSADFYTITEIPEMIISTDDGTRSRAPNIAIDVFNRLHVVWYDGPSVTDYLDIQYLGMDVDGNVLVTEQTLTSTINMDVDWGEPEIATDSGGNAHIVYSTDNNTASREIYYMMVDGDDGSTRIDDTAITLDDDNASVRAFVAIDSKNLVYVVWHDKRLYNLGTGEHELFASILDPSRDDQDGSAADPSVISLISEQMATTDDGYRSYLKNLAIDPGDRVHVAWVDMYGYDPEDEEEWGKGEIYYLLGDRGPVIPETRITYFDGEIDPCYWDWPASSGRNPDIVATCDRAYITFHGYNNTADTCDVYLVILGVPPCSPVGGVILPIDSLLFITPYIAVIIAVVSVAVAVVKKHRY